MNEKVIIFVIASVVCGCRFIQPPVPQQHPQALRDLDNCVQKWSFETNQYLEKLRDKYKYVQKNVVRAKTITTDQYTALTFGDFSLLGEPALFSDKNDAHIVVDSKFFTTLLVVDVPALVEQKKDHVVGNFLAPNTEVFQQVIKFLFTSEIIKTYRYTKSQVCLTQEKVTEEYYQAYFNAHRINDVAEKDQEYYQFSIRIYKKNGQIVVNGA